MCYRHYNCCSTSSISSDPWPISLWLVSADWLSLKLFLVWKLLIAWLHDQNRNRLSHWHDICASNISVTYEAQDDHSWTCSFMTTRLEKNTYFCFKRTILKLKIKASLFLWKWEAYCKFDNYASAGHCFEFYSYKNLSFVQGRCVKTLLLAYIDNIVNQRMPLYCNTTNLGRKKLV